MEKTKINEKRPRLAHFFKKNTFVSFSFYLLLFKKCMINSLIPMVNLFTWILQFDTYVKLQK